MYETPFSLKSIANVLKFFKIELSANFLNYCLGKVKKGQFWVRKKCHVDRGTRRSQLSELLSFVEFLIYCRVYRFNLLHFTLYLACDTQSDAIFFKCICTRTYRIYMTLHNSSLFRGVHDVRAQKGIKSDIASQKLEKEK